MKDTNNEAARKGKHNIFARITRDTVDERAYLARFKSNTVQCALLEVTPELAREFIVCGGVNRPTKEQHAHSLSRAMRRGWFKQTGDTIKIDRAGRVIDGQHRLLAIVHSGVTQMLLVVWGLETDIEHLIDNNLPRTLTDRLVLRGVQDATRKAAWISAIHDVLYRKQGRVSGDLGVEMEREFRRSLNWMSQFAPTNQPLAYPPLLAAFVLAHHKGADKALPFAIQALRDDGDDVSPQAKALRNYAFKHMRGNGMRSGDRRYSVVMKALNAMMAYRTGKRVRLTDSEEGLRFLGYSRAA